MLRVAVDELYSSIELISSHSDIEVSLFSNIDKIDTKSSIDALLVRTNRRIDGSILDQFPNLRFLATASAGFDHFDVEEIERRGIIWSRSTACNSKSVAEYVFATLLCVLDESEVELLSSKTLGIIGLGACGTQVKHIADRLGMKTLCYDPPKQLRDSDFKNCEKNDLKSADFLTIHVPLDESTHHIIDNELLSDSNFSVVINAARGGVLDEMIVNQFSEKKFIVDVWENEPFFDSEVAERAIIRTPHIAGYSYSAKLRASTMAYEALAKHFSILLKESENPVELRQIDSNSNLSSILVEAHPFLDYQNQFDSLLNMPKMERGKGFHSIRNQFPLRNEFHEIRINANELSPNYVNLFKNLGFGV